MKLSPSTRTMPLTFHLASPQALIISNVSSYRRRQSSRCLPSSASNAQQMCFSANATMVLQHLLHLHCDYYPISREGVPDIAMVSNTIIKRVGCNMLQKAPVNVGRSLNWSRLLKGRRGPVGPPMNAPPLPAITGTFCSGVHLTLLNPSGHSNLMTALPLGKALVYTSTGDGGKQKIFYNRCMLLV